LSRTIQPTIDKGAPARIMCLLVEPPPLAFAQLV
jgi:hypothetical protein